MLPYGGKRCKIGTTGGKTNGRICGCCCCRADRRRANISRKKRARAAAKKDIRKALEG